MAWVRLDDQFADHPKVAAAGPLAAWLHTKALVYCGRYLTDGFIPRAIVHALIDWESFGVLVDIGESAESPKNTKLARTLIDVGLWEEADGGYQIHDYLEHNPSAEKVKAERAAEKDRKAAGRSKQGRDARGRITGACSVNSQTGTQTESVRADSGRIPVGVPAVVQADGGPDKSVADSRQSEPRENIGESAMSDTSLSVRADADRTATGFREDSGRCPTGPVPVPVPRERENNNTRVCDPGPEVADTVDPGQPTNTPEARLVAELTRVSRLRGVAGAVDKAKRWARMAEGQAGGKFEFLPHLRRAVDLLANKLVDEPGMRPGQILGYLDTIALASWGKNKSNPTPTPADAPARLPGRGRSVFVAPMDSDGLLEDAAASAARIRAEEASRPQREARLESESRVKWEADRKSRPQMPQGAPLAALFAKGLGVVVGTPGNAPERANPLPQAPKDCQEGAGDANGNTAARGAA